MPTEETTNIVPGEVITGKVQGITNFGAFIELSGGSVGLVHISEIADTYVKDVKDFIKEGDEVKVKVLSVAGKKIGLSIKQAIPKVVKPTNFVPRRDSTSDYNRRESRGNFTKKNEAPLNLDDKIAKFLKESEERMQPLKSKFEHKKRTRF
jgi:S1 RNA binding domain protein